MDPIKISGLENASIGPASVAGDGANGEARQDAVLRPEETGRSPTRNEAYIALGPMPHARPM